MAGPLASSLVQRPSFLWDLTWATNALWTRAAKVATLLDRVGAEVN